MPVPDEKLQKVMAHVDGQLSDLEVGKLEAELATSEELRELLGMFERTARLPRTAYDDILREPVPAHLIAALDADVPRPAGWRARLAPRTGPVLALAASLGLAAGVAIAMALNLPGTNPSRTAVQASGLPATGVLARALDKTAAGSSVSGAGGEQIALVVSYPRRGGGWCREYRIKEADATGFAGIACRVRDNAWQIVAHYPWTPPAGSPGKSIGPAMGTGPLELDPVAERLQGGNRLQPAAEAAIIAEGWPLK